MRKKFLSSMLAVTMVAGMLTGCGNEGSGNSTPTPEPNPTAAPESTPTEAPGSDENTGNQDEAGSSAQSLLDIDSLDNPNIVVDLYWAPNASEQAAIDRYEAKYGAGTVTVNAIGWNKGIPTMLEHLSSGEVSSLIFTEGNACFPSYITENYFQPITEYIQNDIGQSYMDQASMDNFLYCDEYYVFTNAARTQPYLIAYYKPLFEDNGLENPGELLAKGEWTWDNFLNICDVLTVDTDGDGAIDQWGLGPRYKLQHFAYASGIVGISEAGNGFLEAHWDDEGMLSYFDFITKFWAIESRAESNDGWLGTGAMYMEASTNGEMRQFDDDWNIIGRRDEVGFVPVPTLDGSFGATPVWDCGYAIPNGAENPLGGAILAAMILDETAKALRTEQELYMTEEEIDLFYKCMENTIPQRKNDNLYEGVTMSYGESEAKEGVPAATIIDTYKSVVETEVRNYNGRIILQQMGNK